MIHLVLSSPFRGHLLGMGGLIKGLRVRPQPQKIVVRRAGEFLPPSQYDTPWPYKLTLAAAKEYVELVPLLAITGFAMCMVLFHIFWACKNKVDVTFSTHSANNISRTMNLRQPTIHKLIIINQRYEPWPEMQDVLDKMLVAEHRALLKVDVVYTRSGNISRTMDLRNPTVHKIIIINQRYEPWPEMQRTLDEMRKAERRLLDRQQPCFPIKKTYYN